MLINKSDVAFINHDIKNYIGTSITMLQLLELENPNLVGGENVDIVIEGLYRAIELSSEIATISHQRINNKHNSLPKDCTKIEVNSYLREQTKEIYNTLRKRFYVNINYTYKLINEKKYSITNKNLIMRFRENIISNAVHAGASEIDIHHEMKDFYEVSTYIDNGKGMSEDELDKLTLSQYGDGIVNGLGNAIMSQIAKEMGFHFSYTSVENESTTIRIIYPYVDS